MGTVFAQNGYLEHALGTLALMQNRSTEAVPYSLSYLLTTLKASRASHDLIFITLTLIQVVIGAEFLMSGFSYLEFLILVRVALGALATFLRGR